MPASTMPAMWGMRSLPITIGAIRMMASTTKNFIMGSVTGKVSMANGMCYFWYVYELWCKDAKKYREMGGISVKSCIFALISLTK